ncbi:MAG: hypothetical protein NQU46_07700 [Methanolinea sp.]|nr:hypothetical protein [Methanolinea sp.]
MGPDLYQRWVVLAALGGCSAILGYFSIFVSIGSAVVFDPRDILVLLAGVLTGPLGGLVAGLVAGLPGQDRVLLLPLFVVAGLAGGLIARYGGPGQFPLPAAALGLGGGYLCAGAVAMVMGLHGEIASLAFRSLVMQYTCILVLSIIESVGPFRVRWDTQPCN